MARVSTSSTTAVEGLGEFRRALKQLEGDYPKQLGAINAEIAQLVIDDATSLAEAGGGPYLAALRLRGIKASKAQTAAAIVLGGPAAPMTLGAEFGAKHYPQFGRWTGAGDDAGHAVWPAIRANQARAAARYLERLDELAADAFPD